MKWTPLILGALVQAGRAAATVFEAEEADPAGFRVELASDFLGTNDGQWLESAAEVRWQDGADEVRLTAEQGWMGFDYQPARGLDFFGYATRIEGDHEGGHMGWRRTWGTWQGHGRVGGYSGFQDYRALWLSEYYFQQYDGFAAYRRPDPAGVDMLVGLGRECGSRRLMLRGDVGLRRDWVAPGYTIGTLGLPIRGREVFDTVTGRIEVEAVPSSVWRLSGELRMQETTSRDIRYGGLWTAAGALAPHFVLHATLGGALEPSNFYAGSAQLGMEVDRDNRWFAGVSGRLYADDGEWNPASPAQRTAPGLQARALEMHLRFVSDRWSWLLAAGPYWTDYGRPVGEQLLLSNLYLDRSWVSCRMAVALNF